jgi:hypothetical protein
MLYELAPHHCAIRISWSLDPTIFSRFTAPGTELRALSNAVAA